MIKKLPYKLLMLMLICFMLLVSCSDAGPTSVNSDAAQSPTPAEFTTQLDSSQVLKTIQPDAVSSLPEVPHGVIYKGYLLDYYEALYGPMGPVSLANACRSLDIKLTWEDTRKKDEFMDSTQGSWSPEVINLEKGGSRLMMKVDGNRDEYYKERAYPSVPYKVFKDGKEISFKSVFAYKGHIYISSLKELLSALDIKYYENDGNTYVDSDKATDIKGRILYCTEIELEKSKKTSARLIYNYDEKKMPCYSDIELQISNRAGMYVKVFDSFRYGSSKYYSYGTISQNTTGKDNLIKVDLSDAPTNGNIDTMVYRVSTDRIEVSSIEAYSGGNTISSTPPAVDKLEKKINVENMNDKNNRNVSLILPKGWYAKGYFNDIAPDFEFESKKNRHIKKGWSYELFNSNVRTDFYQYGIDSTFGYFDLPSYYRDHPEEILMRNHAQIKKKVYSGETILGKGDIYIVDVDLPKERRTEDKSTYDEVYAWIPVKGEQLAYNLQVDVPAGEQTEKYLGIVEHILGIKD